MDPHETSRSLSPPAETVPPAHAATVGGGARTARAPWILRFGSSALHLVETLLTSVKFGVFLLVVLALGAIAGTFIESAIGTPEGTPVAQRWVYHAWWYIIVMVFLAITLNAASWPSYERTWRWPRFRSFKRRPRLFNQLPVVRKLETPATVDQVKAALQRHLGPVHQDGRALFAQRGVIQRWGFVITHAGMTLMLAGGVFLSVMAHYQGPPGTMSMYVGEGMARNWIWVPAKQVEITIDLRLLDEHRLRLEQVSAALTQAHPSTRPGLVAPVVAIFNVDTDDAEAVKRTVISPEGREAVTLSQVAQVEITDDILERRGLPFVLRLHDFDADFFPGTDVPRYFGSEVEIVDPEGNSTFHRITMNEALRWNGWKFSQNAYSFLDQTLTAEQAQQFAQMDGPAFSALRDQGRFSIRLVESATGREFPAFDAAVGVRVPVPQSDLQFQLLDGENFELVHEGMVHARGTVSLDSGPKTVATASSEGDWSIRIDQLFPNYRRDETGAEATNGDAMTNPAVHYTLFHGQTEIGSDTAFLSDEFRDMTFSDLPLQVRLTGIEPSLETYTDQPIIFSIALVRRGSNQPLETAEVSLRETRAFTSDAVAAIAPPIEPAPSEVASGPYTATIAGRQAGAYSVLGVMRESMATKIFFFISFVLFGFGPYLAFTTCFRQVWALVDDTGVLLGGRAWGRKAGLTKTLDLITADLQEQRA